MAYRESEDVDDLLGMFAQHMGSQDSAAIILDQDFECGVF
jgi:hypothetical protein